MEEIQEIVPTIENLVSTANLGCKLDLTSKLDQNHSKSMEEIQEIVPTIENLFSTVNLGCKLDLISKLDQNHSISMEEIHEEIVPTIENLVSRVNLGCKLDLISKLDQNHSKSMEEKQEIILPTIQNVVSTVNLGCKLDLTAIASHARNAEYNRKRFSALIMRIREPRTTALIFASGKLVCTGAKSESDSKLAARKYARIVQKLGFPVDFINFKIQNIVGSCDVKFAIKLELLKGFHSEFALYEPEVFPGMIYRMMKPKIVLLIFVSGKIVLTGAKVRQHIYDAFANIFPVLDQFKKKQQLL